MAAIGSRSCSPKGRSTRRSVVTVGMSRARGMAVACLPMPIREATDDDLGEICALIRELADYERLSHEVEFDVDEVRDSLFGPSPVASVLMAVTDDGSVAGFALWYPTFSTFLGRAGIWLEDLFVRPSFRGQGFGLSLLERLR